MKRLCSYNKKKNKKISHQKIFKSHNKISFSPPLAVSGRPKVLSWIQSLNSTRPWTNTVRHPQKNCFRPTAARSVSVQKPARKSATLTRRDQPGRPVTTGRRRFGGQTELERNNSVIPYKPSRATAILQRRTGRRPTLRRFKRATTETRSIREPRHTYFLRTNHAEISDFRCAGRRVERCPRPIIGATLDTGN